MEAGACMRKRDTYWSLFHTPEKRQIDDLKTDAIEVVFEVIPAKDRGDWLVWREGFATWKPLNDFQNLLTSLRKGGMLNAASVPAPAPAQKDVATRVAGSTAPVARAKEVVHESKPVTRATAEPKNETTIQERLSRQGSLESEVDLDIMNETELGDRADRYRKKWQVRILTDSKPIMLTTVDVSNRGMSFKEPLPKGLPRYFNVEVIANEITVPLICSEVRSKEGGPSTRVRIEVCDDPSLWQTALLQ
jgi:hypothetical protein